MVGLLTHWRPKLIHEIRYHKVLKSRCRADQSKLRTTARVTNLLAVLCVVGWRVFWQTMAARLTPEVRPEVALTPTEIGVVDRLAGGPPPRAKRNVAHYIRAVAKLGGYLARTQDPPPGNMVIWRGFGCLADLCCQGALKTGH